MQTCLTSQNIEQFPVSHAGIINFRIYLQAASLITSAISEGKKAKKKVQNFEYIKNERSFFGQIKINFHNFLSTFLWQNIQSSGYKP